MLADDVADGPALGPHDQGAGGCAAGAVANTLHELPVGDAGRDEEDVVAADEVVGAEHAGKVVTGRDSALAFGVVLGPQLALDDATDALDRAGRDDALRRAADAEQQIDAGVVARGHDGAGHVTVADELDPGTCIPDLLHQVAVPGSVEHHDGHVFDRAVLGFGDRLDVVLDRRFDVDVVGSVRPGDELLHVEDGGRVIHRAAIRHRHDGDRVVHALGGQRGAVDRVDGDVAVGPVAVADLLAVVEHRRFVLLALTDDDDAVHRHGGDELAHGVGSGCVGAVLVAPPDPSPCGHRRGFGDPDQLEGEVAVGLFGPDAQGSRDSGHRHVAIVSARPAGEAGYNATTVTSVALTLTQTCSPSCRARSSTAAAVTSATTGGEPSVSTR